jgi:hypothetical protein
MAQFNSEPCSAKADSFDSQFDKLLNFQIQSPQLEEDQQPQTLN